MLEEINQKLQELHIMQADIDNANKRFYDYKQTLDSSLDVLGFCIATCNNCYGSGKVKVQSIQYQNVVEEEIVCPVCKGTTYRIYKNNQTK